MKLIASGVTCFGRQHQVALVLAVLLVDQDHDPAGLHLGHDLLDRGDAGCRFVLHAATFAAQAPSMRST
jgi:hypothetical protein